jgi:hypothetical protein
MDEESEKPVASSWNNSTCDDEDGNCRRCGHPFNPHKIIAYDVSDFSKGGEMRCQVEDCPCFSTVSFDFGAKAND